MVLPWMRHLLITMGIGLALVVVFAAWMLYISPEARTGSRNRHHAHLVQLGMSQHGVLAIMGPPHDVSKYPVDGRMQVNYSYKAGPLASDDIHIMVGPDSLVSYR
jgi:hypothetical protein